MTSFCREVGPLSYSRMKVLRLDGNKMSHQQLPPDWVFCLRVLESIYIWLRLNMHPKQGYCMWEDNLVSWYKEKKRDSTWDLCFVSQLVICEVRELSLKATNQRRRVILYVLSVPDTLPGTEGKKWPSKDAKAWTCSLNQCYFITMPKVLIKTFLIPPVHSHGFLTLIPSFPVLSPQGCTSVCYYWVGTVTNPLISDCTE